MPISVVMGIKLLPLILYALMGYVAAKYFDVKKTLIASLLIYFLLPIVTFHGIFSVSLTPQILLLPVIFYLLAVGITVLFLKLGNHVLKDSRANVMAFGTSYGNYAYFAIPAAVAFWGSESEAIIIAAGFGFTLYTTTFGYFITARGKFSLVQSFLKTIKLPATYAFVLGLVANYLGFYQVLMNHGIWFHMYQDTIKDLRGMFSILGLMLLGVAFASIKKVSLDWKFLSLGLLGKSIVWPVCVILLITLDKNFFHIITSPLYYNVMVLLAIVPTGTTLVAYAANLGVHPDKASMQVIISSLLALLYIPLFLGIWKY